MRVPLAVSLESRDGAVDQDARVVNGIVETKGEQSSLRKRPGLSDMGLVRVGAAQLLFSWNGIKAILGDYMNQGTIATIISGPTQTNLSPTNAGLQFSAQDSGSDAATTYLMIKNRSQAWTVNRAGTITAITYGDSMGASTYSLISVTRSGATATATMATDIFNVGDVVTVAGAVQTEYNGAMTITALTVGSYTPARVIPITITRSGTTATATTVSGNHGLTTATAYTIGGANDAAYNGSKTITTTGTTTFTYTVTVTTDSTKTWNAADKDANVVLSGASLVATRTISSNGSVRATAGKASGKWYWEVTPSGVSFCYIGVSTASEAVTATYVGNSATGWAWYNAGEKVNNASFSVYGASFGAGDVIGVALDMDSGTITFYMNGVSQGQAFSGLTGTVFPAVTVGGTTTTLTANFGATAFAHSIPSGFYAFQSNTPLTPASGTTITVTDPAVTVNATFSYTVAGTPATPATGTITAQGTGGTVPGIGYINGYFCVMDVNGVIWNSASDNPTSWGALAFITAQNENGAGKALAKSGSYLIAFKEWSTEFFFDNSNADGSPFSPVDNGFTQVGCASGDSLASVEGALMWISQSRQQGRGVYLQEGLQQQRVSTPDIDRILNADSLLTVRAYGLKIDGHSLYVLTLVASDITLVYDLNSQTWGQWTSLTRGSSKSVTSITRSGTTATVTFAVAHTLTDGAPVEISGATQTEYNGKFQAEYVSTTVIKIEVAGSPTTPATGTIVGYPYTESYFKFTKYVNHNGLNLFLHESDGHLYQMQSSLFRDAGIPISVQTRSVRMDGGSTGRKKLALIRVIGDTVADTAMIRWSDDDCATFSAFRRVDLSSVEPEIRRCGAFKRRTFELKHTGNYPLNLTALEMEIGQ